jgi:hypothetical protein
MRELGIYPRLSYAVVVVFSVVVASLLAIEIAVGLAKAYSFTRRLSSNAYLLAVLLAFLFPGIRALVRVARRHPFLSASERDLRKYVVAVTILGSVGHLLSFQVAVAYYEILVEGKESSGVGFGAALAGLCYLMALWIGEFVIMRVTKRVTTEPSKVGSS